MLFSSGKAKSGFPANFFSRKRVCLFLELEKVSMGHGCPRLLFWTNGRTHGRTHGRTDRRTDGHGQRLMPFHILRIAGAYWDKIVGGVALTRYLMSISFCSNLAQKWLSSNCEKSDKNWSEGYIEMSCTSSVLDKNNSKVSKGLG